MDRAEFIAAQERIGCTGAQLAKWLGVKPLTVTRWRQGHVPIPRLAKFAMDRLEQGWRP